MLDPVFIGTDGNLTISSTATGEHNEVGRFGLAARSTNAEHDLTAMIHGVHRHMVEDVVHPPGEGLAASVGVGDSAWTRWIVGGREPRTCACTRRSPASGVGSVANASLVRRSAQIMCSIRRESIPHVTAPERQTAVAEPALWRVGIPQAPARTCRCTERRPPRCEGTNTRWCRPAAHR